MPISVEYLIVGGGGGGGSDSGGGGGGGGVLTGTASKNYGTTFTVTVGNGGNGGNYPTDGTNGGNSVFDNLTATGGGKGQTETKTVGSGGSGGGGAAGPGLQTGGAGTSGQGNAGGNGSGVNPSTYGDAGGGGGAGGAGSAPVSGNGGAGGNGVASSITGTSITYGGGGGGGTLNNGTGGTGGTGGGGNGGGTANVAGANGTDGLGGGGGGASNDTGGTHEAGGNGGKGVVVLKFLTADTGTPTTTGSPTITTSGSYKVYKFTSSGTISFSDPNASVTQDKTNIAIAGKDATVVVGTDIIVNADVTNVAVDGKDDISFILDQNISTDVTNISILGYEPIVVAGGNVTIPSTQNTINIAGKDSTLIIGITQTTTSTNISLAGTEVNVLYPTLVLNNNPIHYYKFDSDGSPTVITDLGSNPVNLTWSLGESIDYYDGIPGDPLSESALFNISADNPNGSDILTFASNIFTNENNYTIEFWIKTLDPYVAIICADKNNQTISGKTYRNNAIIGIRDGCLAFWIHRETGAADVIKTTNKLNNNIWNHVVLTKETIESTIQYKSYVNAQETNALISLGDFMPWILDAPRPSLMNYLNDDGSKQTGHTYSAYLDEFAIYGSTLSQSHISEHYNSGHGIGNDVTVSAEVADIDIDAKDASTGTVINTEVTNIKVKDKGTILAIVGLTGGPTNKVVIVGTTVSNVDTNGKTISSTADAFIDVDCQSTNINLNKTNTNIKTRLSEFKFVASSDTSLSAEDSEAITELDFGGLLYNQIKKLSFAIANTRTTPCNFNITIVSNEEIVPTAVQISNDNITYFNSITIESVRPNSITNPIYVKFDVNILEVLGPGTFLLNVEQI